MVNLPSVALKVRCGRFISAALTELIETKHLYQYVPVIFSQFIDATVAADAVEYTRQHLQVLGAIDRWFAVEESYDTELPPRGVHDSLHGHLIFEAPRLRVYCAHCKRVEPQKCEGTYSDVTSFFLVYQCLACSKARITFLVEREGQHGNYKLRLSGRFPMEQVAPIESLPPFLQTYYSEAVIAGECGFLRMGIFGLRTVIEQWAREVSQMTGKVDGASLFMAYMALLPPGFSSLYPSLAALYDDLSTDMHGAVGDDSLFERARKEIKSHFGALQSLPSRDPKIEAALKKKT